MVNGFSRARAVPVTRPNAGYDRRLWDLGSSTVETPHEWWSAICKQEVRGSIPRVSTHCEGSPQSGRRRRRYALH